MDNALSSRTTEGTPSRNRRKNYIVDPAFQWKYAIMIALAVFLISTIMSTVLYGVLHRQARLRMMSPETYVAEITLVIVVAAVAFAVLTAAGVGAWGLLITHRICGPLTVMSTYLTELAKGRFPALRPLRQKDEFKEFYAHFSRAVDSLRSRREREVRMLDEALRLAKGAAKASAGPEREVAEGLSRQIEALRNELAGTLSAPREKPASTPATCRVPAEC